MSESAAKMYPAHIEFGPIEERDYSTACTVSWRAFGDEPDGGLGATLEPPELRGTPKARIERAANRIRYDMLSGRFDMMVARDTSKDGEVIGFAIWRKPDQPPKIPKLEEKSDEEKRAYEGYNLDAYGELIQGLEFKIDEILGSQKNRLAIDPVYQGMKVGSRLLQHGCDLAQRENVPCTLAASPAGKLLYERRGFKQIGWGRLPGMNEDQPLMAWYPQSG